MSTEAMQIRDAAPRYPADTEVQVGLGQLQFGEEPVRHGVIPVLAGVHDGVARGLFERFVQRGKLDELRARADNRHDAHTGARLRCR